MTNKVVVPSRCCCHLDGQPVQGPGGAEGAGQVAQQHARAVPVLGVPDGVGRGHDVAGSAMEEAVAQLVPLPVLPLVLPLLEFEELQPTVSSRLPVTAATAAMACLARKMPSQTTVPAGGT
jgi:hypothetical protein